MVLFLHAKLAICFQCWPLYFGHFWSLAIEEQFYLFWPIVVYYSNQKLLSKIGGIAIVGALLLRIYFVFILGQARLINTFPYFSTVARVDSLLIGAMVAIGIRFVSNMEDLTRDAQKGMLLSVVIVAACILIQPASPLYNNGAMLTVGFSGLALLTGALIIILLTKTESNIVRRVFRNRILNFFGKYSYALYVFHWPVTSFMLEYYLKMGYQGFVPWLIFIVGAFAATFTLALLSWNLMEKPILGLKRYF